MHGVQQLRGNGHIRLFVGPMFSGKSTAMLMCVERYHIANRRCLIIKHSDDLRYAAAIGGIVTHDGIERALVRHIATTALASVDVREYDVIGVSETQFFGDLLIVDKWANSGKIVICEGLDGTYAREPFGLIHKLMPLCEEVTKLSGVCIRCGSNSCFTQKIGGDMNTVKEIGGIEKYVPLCRRCYMASGPSSHPASGLREAALCSRQTARQLLLLGELPSESAFKTTTRDKLRLTTWIAKDRLHSFDDLPAFVTSYRSGWYMCGLRHRVNGPAVITCNQFYKWMQYGLKHREDGPAVYVTTPPEHSDMHAPQKYFIRGIRQGAL